MSHLAIIALFPDDVSNYGTTNRNIIYLNPYYNRTKPIIYSLSITIQETI